MDKVITKRGRPPKGPSALLAPVMVRFPQAMLEEIDKLIEARLDQPDRSSVIRELIAEALASRSKKDPRK